MTTVEGTAEMNLHAAVVVAGDSGTIRRYGDDYTVRLIDNDWYLERYGIRESLGTYVTDGWTVVTRSATGQPANVEVEEQLVNDELPDYDSESPTTARQFFHNDVTYWTYVRRSGMSGEYVYYGMEFDEAGHEIIVLVHSRYMSELILTDSELSVTNDWEVILDDDGLAKTADMLSRMALRNLRGTRNEVTALTETVQRLETELYETRSDFWTVNTKINEYADDQSYCSDYERRIFGWNSDFKRMSLKGRPDRQFVFSVPVRVPALSSDPLYVSVEGCSSPEEAREVVQSYSQSEVLRALVNSGAYIDELSIEHPDSEVMF